MKKTYEKHEKGNKGMKYALTNVHILNGHRDMTAVSGKAVIVEDGKIADIPDENAIPAGTETVDLGGRYLLPGLINLHVHIPSGGKPSKKKINYEKLAKLLKLGAARAVVQAMCADYAKQQLYSGTTTIRAVGGVLDFDTKLRDKINAGKKEGPRILAADWAISVPGGHMTGSVAMPAHSPEEAAAMVRALDRQKPDLIKLMITGGVLDAVVPGEPGILKMPREYIRAAAEEAHRLGYPVAAHVESTEGMLAALENGVDTLEHGGKPNDEVIRLFRETGAVLIGTLSPAVPFAVMDAAVTGMTETDLLNGKALFQNMRDCIRACLDNGIPVGLGTDTGCPFITHYDMWRELWYYCRYCDVTPAFALHTATELNARLVGIDGITGSVDVGKSADFLIADGNPLDDLTVLRTPYEVIFRGKRIRNPKPKKYPMVERELDQILAL